MATKKIIIAAVVAVMLMAAPAQVKASGFTGDFGVEDGNFVEQHIHEYSVSTSESTCTTEGCIITSCGCGDSSVEVVPALGHDYVTETVSATCTAEGSVTTTCTRCGDGSVETTPALGHDYVTETVPATCTAEGSVTTTCTRCGDGSVETTPALGHDYVTETVPATETTDGSITTSCNRCGDSSSQVIPATGVEVEAEPQPEEEPEVVPSEPAVEIPDEEVPAVVETEPVIATYSQREKVVVAEEQPEVEVGPVVVEELPLAEARQTNFGLWWLLLPFLFILLCHQYHLVLVARDEQGEEDVTILMFTWSIKKVMKKVAKLKDSNPDAELRIIHFFRGKGKRVVYSWSAEAERSEFMSRHEAKVAETVLGFVYQADGETEVTANVV